MTSTSLDPTHPQPMNETNAWREAFKEAWNVYWPIRLLLLGVGLICGLLALPGLPSDFAHSWIERVLLAPWDQFDTTWYLKIARDGYDVVDGRATFHPLIPILIGGLGRILGGQYLLAGFIINDISCILALALMYRWLRLDFEPKVAHDAIQWLAYVPVGFVFFIPYTEALTLVWILGTFWFWRQERWLLAGVCGALASLTKHSAIALPIALFVDYVYRFRHDLLRWAHLRALMGWLLMPLGYLAFSTYRVLISNNAGSGIDLLKFIIITPDLKEFWGNEFAAPWTVLIGIIRGPWYPYITASYWFQLVLTIGAVIACIKVMPRIWFTEKVYILIQLFLIFTVLVPDDPTKSFPRRFLLLPAVFLQLALWSTKNPVDARRWRLISLVMMVFLVIGFISLKFVP